MIKTTFADHHSWTRTLVACLIISLMVLSPLAPLTPSASAAPKPAKPAAAPPTEPAAAPRVEPATAPLVPAITATKTDSFADADADGKAAPGETITYDVNVTNNGTDATGVNFTDTIDTNTTLLGGSLKVSPLAYADTFFAAKDTPLSVGTPGVLTNDTGIPSPTAVAIAGGATAQGGTVTLNTNGSFLYNPPAGFTGTDTFNYTATNGLTPNDTAQVTITVDAPPSVTSTTPTNGASNQALNSDVTITFSEAVNVTGNWFQIVCTNSGTRNVADTVVTGGPTTFTVNPNADFTENETCTVTVFAAQVSDQDGNDPPDNMTADFVFSFTTQDAAPSVSSTTPTNGATNQLTNTNIDVTFSEAVNVTGNWFQIVCTSSGTRNVADTVVTGGPSAFTINPNADFVADETCTVTVFAAQVTDQDSDDPPDNMAANYVFSFATEAAPTVNATTPTNGATQVANNTNITLTFSEPVNVTGNWFQIVGSTSGTRNVADTVVTGGPTTFTINPNVDFVDGESVTVTVFAAQVTDQDAIDPPDNMASNFAFSFTIDQPPSVSATTPTNGATNQATNTNLTITFSEPINVTGNWFQIVCASSGTRNVADTVVTGGPTTFTINPNADFTAGESCTVTVFAAQVTDQDSADPPDNMVANYVFSFQTTDVAPTVSSTTPTNGATNQGTNTNIDVTFSEPVNVTGNWFQIVCTSSGTRNVVDTVVTGGPTTFTINPNTDFTQGETCTVTVFAAQVTDQDSNDPPDNMAANFVFSFSMDAAPSVTATTPTNGATQIAGNTNVSITFSEPVNVTGNWFQIVGATSGTRNVADTVVTGGPTTFTINPNVDFTTGELVTVTVFAAQVTDQDSADPPDNMTANHVFSFTIDQAPSVTATTPTNGATNVALNSNLSITFSEPVNVTGNWFQVVCPTSGTRNVADTVVTGGPTTFTINPNADFTFNETCTVTVFAAQISDQDSADPPDNMTANFVFSYTTVDAAPTVTATTPTNGATNQATTTNVDVTFSEPVNVTGNWFQIACTTSGTRLPGATVVTGGPTTFTINPNVDFTSGETCTVTIFAAQVTDQDTNDPPDNMAANFVFSFTIDTPPAVTTTIPTNGATQVATNTNITINFNENVNIQDSTAFTVECPVATPIAFNVTPVAPGGTNSFILDPTSDLPVGTICTVTVVASKVTDVDAGDPPDNMVANFVFSFTTDQAPFVTTTIPTNNATDVALNSTITINFSENVDVASGGVTINCGSTVNFTPGLPLTNLNSLVLTPTGGLPAGSNCTVTVDKTKISDVDASDPPDNMVNDFVFSFKVKPDAVNDTYPGTLIGNVGVNSANVPYSVTGNDVSANTFSITAVQAVSTVVAGTITAASANGGTVVMSVSGGTIGRFTYNPPAGFEGTDTFTYTISRDDGGGTDTATVSMPISGMIWFINNNAGSCVVAGCGRLSNPFSTLAAFQALNNGTGNNPAANDNIFVYESAIDYVGPVTLLNGQKFIGQDATATLATITSLTPPSGSDPLPVMNSGNGTITNITSAGVGITLGQNNTLRGFTGGNAVPDITGNNFGTLTVADVTLNGNGQALNLTTGTLAAVFLSITSTNSATTGISLTSVGGSLTTGSTTITNPTGIGISANTSSATLGFANTSVTSSGGTGVSLTTNTGAITFGSLTITPDASQRGLLATDNTQTITITSGTISTTTNTAVEITRASSTTPLAVSLTAVSANGGSRGIMLSNTSGNFTITGTGGTCTNANTSGCSGGTIASSTGADDSSAIPVGTGVVLNNATNVSLTRMFIHDHSNYGIRGTSVTGFTLDNSVLNGTNGTDAPASAASPFNEGTIKINNLAGSATISNTFISGGISNNVLIDNTTATVNRVTFTNDTIGANSTNNGEDGIQLQSETSGRILATIQNTTFTSARGDLFNFLDNATSGSADDLIFNNNTLSNNHPAIATGGGGVTISSNGTKDFTFHMESNTMRDAVGHAVLLVKSTGTASYSGTFTGNTIGVAATNNSGSKEGSGLKVQSAGQGTVTVAITNNQIHQYNNNGIELLTGGGASAQSGTFNATITGNTVDTPGNNAATNAIPKNGIHLNGGTVVGDTYAICAQIGGAGALANSISTSGKDAVPPTGAGDLDFRLRQRQSTTVRLPGYGGANNDNTAVQNFIIANNSGNGAPVGAASNTVPTGGGFVGGAACTSPLTMAQPLNSTFRDTLAQNREVKRSAPQTVSHHATIARRENVTSSTQVAPAAAATTRPTIMTPVAYKPVVNKIASRQPVNAQQDKTRRGIIVKPRVGITAGGGETVTHSVGTLLAGKTVHIQFQVTVNSPYLGGATVSNQGTVSGSNFSDVMTDDPAAGGANDPTTTPILLTPNISISDAQANEPASGSAPMIFTVALSAPAPAGGASVHYATADQAPALNHAVAGVDYTAIPDTVLSFAAGEQFKTIIVNVLADGNAPEVDETFLVNLSNPTNAVIVDNQAIGTIKQGNAAGTFLISEIRTSGPAGDGDDFVELYNNSDTPLTIAASDASGGYGLFKMGADCNATPVLIGVIPNGTVIPARGHYLFVGSTYSLADYGGTGAAAGNQTLSADIESDGNVGIFNTASIGNLSSVTRLDAVGFGNNTGGTCDLLREGTTLPPLGGSTLQHSYVRDECGKKGNPATFGPCPAGGLPKDSNVNDDDFIFIDTSATVTVAGQRLGAPGPQNLVSPIQRNSTITTLLLDSNFGGPASPNRFRDLTPQLPNAQNGTLSVRRRVVNNTGAPVTRLRFRIVDISTISVPGGIADIRALTSTSVVVSGVTDSGTCQASTGSATTPCTVTVEGTTLETPPAQSLGGGHNATMTVTLGTPLAPGASINVQFLLGVQQTGSFKFFFNVEALP
ncbi:MAG TPA: Ig-like domain-containing protein [Pyrinomonadaceae bacterium]